MQQFVAQILWGITSPYQKRLKMLMEDKDRD
jgi:hypothetical protein